MTMISSFGRALPTNAAPVSPLVAPSQAAAFGLNRLVFQDDFTSLATIDLNNTRAAGFKWYVNNSFSLATQIPFRSYPPTLGSSFSIVNGTVLQTSTGDGLMSLVDNGLGGVYGAAFAPPFYWEASVAFNPNDQAGNHPAFWTMAQEMLLGVASNWVEFDVFESLGSNQGFSTVHDWINQSQTSNTNNLPGWGNPPTLTSLNTFGLRVIPTTSNAGTGLIDFYLNNVLLSSNSVTFTTTGPASPGMTGSNYNGILSECNTQHYPIMFSWQGTDIGGHNMLIDWVHVWQA